MPGISVRNLSHLITAFYKISAFCFIKGEEVRSWGYVYPDIFVKNKTRFSFLLQDNGTVVGNAELKWSQAGVWISAYMGHFYSSVNGENVRLLSPAVGHQCLSNSLPLFSGQMSLSVERFNSAFLYDAYFWSKGYLPVYLSQLWLWILWKLFLLTILFFFSFFLFYFMNLGKVQTQQEWSALAPKVIMWKFLTPEGEKTMKTGTPLCRHWHE